MADVQQDGENLREPQQKEEVLKPNTHHEVPGEQEQEEETHVDTKHQEVEQVEPEDGQAHGVPVHQGQPEI